MLCWMVHLVIEYVLHDENDVLNELGVDVRYDDLGQWRVRTCAESDSIRDSWRLTCCC